MKKTNYYVFYEVVFPSLPDFKPIDFHSKNPLQNGLFSAIPYIAFWIAINIFGVICDGLIKSGKLNVKNARKLMTGLGMIPPAILLIATGYVDCNNAVWAIVLLTFAQVNWTGKEERDNASLFCCLSVCLHACLCLCASYSLS